MNVPIAFDRDTKGKSGSIIVGFVTRQLLPLSLPPYPARDLALDICPKCPGAAN